MIRFTSRRHRQTTLAYRALNVTTFNVPLALIACLSATGAFAQPADPTMTCELSSDTASAGTNVTLDVFLEDAVDVQGYQATIRITRLSGPGWADLACPGGVTVEEYRPDYIFSGLDTLNREADCADCGVIAPHCRGRRLAAARVAGGVDIGAMPANLATFTLETASHVQSPSTFEISILPFPASIVTGSDYEPVPFSIGPSCVLTIEGIGGTPPLIPAVSEWGLAVLTLLLATAGTIVVSRRGRQPPKMSLPYCGDRAFRLQFTDNHSSPNRAKRSVN